MTRSHEPAHLRGLALATLFPGFAGVAQPPAWLQALIVEGLGGVVLFRRNVDRRRGDRGVAALTARLRADRADLLVAVDEEGGDVTRLDATTGSDLPGNAALGAVDDPVLTHEVAASLGARLRGCGVDVNLAPVTDLDIDPQNPVVGVRAWLGSTPRRPARAGVRRGSAVLAGRRDGQALPGTRRNRRGQSSHGADRPNLRRRARRARARAVRAAIAADVQIVMTAHITVPALDPHRPATLSRNVVTGLLRDQLGFDGVVMTDGLDMRAISGTVGQADGAVLALAAGVDALCVGGESASTMVEAIVTAVVAAVESGRLGYGRLAEAAGRVRRLARWVAVAPDGRAAAGRSVGERAARRAVVTRGRVEVAGPPVVLEQDESSTAAGLVPWGSARRSPSDCRERWWFRSPGSARIPSMSCSTIPAARSSCPCAESAGGPGRPTLSPRSGPCAPRSSSSTTNCRPAGRPR